MAEEIGITINKTELPIREHIVKNDTEFKIVDLEQVIKRLEQENKELKEENIEYDEELAIEKLSHKSDLETLERYRSALEEIRILATKNVSIENFVKIQNRINEVLNDN